MAFPIAPVSMPADLAGRTNGKLPDELLSDVDGGGRLHHLAARAWRALVDAAWREVGLPLTFTYGGTYRPYTAQETLFRSRYTPGGPGGGCKLWDSNGDGTRESWCKKSSNLATAAVPGTSNHGWGLAIDTAWDRDLTDGIGPDDATGITSHPGWSWLLANAHRFGFSWELQSEPWHIRYVTGDTIPPEVHAFEGQTTPPPQPPPTPIQGVPDVFYPINPFRNSDTRVFGGPGVAPGVDHLFELNTAVFPAGTTAVALNVVALGAAAPGFVTVWPDGQPQPNSSFINFRGDGGAYNGAIVVGVTAGKFRLETSATCHVIVDATGYWTN